MADAALAKVQPPRGLQAGKASPNTVVCLTLAKWETVSGQFGGYLKPITVVVPFPAGGPSDVVARIVSEHMSRTLRQQMVIENVGGAGGTLGSARVAAAQPDGYTLLAGSMGSHVAAPVLTPNVKYDSERDFEPVGLTAHSPAVIVARKDFPATNLNEFVSYLKQNSDKVKEAHGGVGASSHMACLLFNQAMDIRPTLVAYRGTAPAMNDLIGGHVDFLCEQSVSVAEQIKAGVVRGYVAPPINA